MFAQAKDAFGHVDSVFANAGVLAEQASSILDDETGPGAIEKTIAVNAIGTTYTVRHALKHVTDGGSIILTSSGGGSVPSGAFAGILPAESAINVYGATKGYVDAYGRALATPPTIRSYTLSPLLYLSEMAHGSVAEIVALSFHTYFKTPGDPAFLAEVVEHMVAGTTAWPSGSNVVCEGNYCHDAQIRYNQLYGDSIPPSPLIAGIPPAALRDARGAPAGLTLETIAGDCYSGEGGVGGLQSRGRQRRALNGVVVGCSTSCHPRWLRATSAFNDAPLVLFIEKPTKEY